MGNRGVVRGLLRSTVGVGRGTDGVISTSGVGVGETVGRGVGVTIGDGVGVGVLTVALKLKLVFGTLDPPTLEFTLKLKLVSMP